MNLTQGQGDALKMVERLLNVEGAAFGVLSGYAGTGKTTLLKVIAEQEGPPLILTPTGKAAIRVTEATDGLGASTIHRWMYKVEEDTKTGEPSWTRKPLDEIYFPENRLVVVDEASMISQSLWKDIWGVCSNVGLKVLLVGDPFQLPPVNSDDVSFSTLVNLETPYRVDLTEVVRQALDSPVIRASMLIRQGEQQTMEALFQLPDAKPSKLVDDFLAMDANRAMVVWRNATRQSLNQQIRARLGQPEHDIAVGEPLLVMYNNYAIDRFNGEVVDFGGWEFTPKEGMAVRNAHKNLSITASYGVARVDGVPLNVMVSPEEVFNQVSGMEPKIMARHAGMYAKKFFGYDYQQAPPHLSANFGYCLTAHKAQGSEWNDAMVLIEENFKLYSREGRRWLYTAVTRARKQAHICIR